MKTLFRLHLDGIYTNIEKQECENHLYKYRLEEAPDFYFKTFSAAKKAALIHMNNILNDWKYAVKAMKQQNKENY